MWDKELLSPVQAYTPTPKLARSTPASVPLAPDTEVLAHKADLARDRDTRALDFKALEQALDNLSTHVQNLQRSLLFSVDRDSGETIVRIVDSETHAVIRQIPSQELLAIEQHLRSSTGVLLSAQV